MQQTTFVLGGPTGRTGSLVTRKLIERGLNARTASRHGCSNGTSRLFDWDEPTDACQCPGRRRPRLPRHARHAVKYAGLVSDFLDFAAGAGVRYVTYLSTYGSDQALLEVNIRAVELDLAVPRSLHALKSCVPHG